jgi:ketosteroid isomerase-like protein
MKKIASLLLTLLLTNFVYAQQASSKDQQEVHQTVIRLFDALSARDAAALRNQCTADVRFYEYGEAWPADTLIHLAITKNTATDFRRTNTLDFIATTIKGDVAWTTYALHSAISANGKQAEVYWMETVILTYEEKSWKISVLHSTRVNKN